MQHLPGDAELTRRLGNGEIERREHALAQDRAGVDGLHFEGLLGGCTQASSVSSEGVSKASPEGAAACSLGRQPQVGGALQTQSPNGATAVFLGARTPRMLPSFIGSAVPASR
jgi:hypothetical protein